MSDVLKSYAEHHRDMLFGVPEEIPEIIVDDSDFIEAFAKSQGYKKIGGEYFSPEYLERNT